MFSERSRYANQPTRERVMPDGRRLVFVLPRLTPPPQALAVGARIVATDSDRLDNLAYRHLGTPEAWWMIADANRAMDPETLLIPAGRDVAIPVPGPKGRPG